SLWELGRAVMRMPPFDSPASFLEALRSARIEGRISPAWVHTLSTLAKLLRRFGLSPPPPG
ncbi:MAG: hypothetical protein N2556_08335, partial [Anaerolineae bacterium]|nr:hypothetical protein [Anaerolineae bacterium]